MLTFLSSFSGFFDKNGEDLASSKSFYIHHPLLHLYWILHIWLHQMILYFERLFSCFFGGAFDWKVFYLIQFLPQALLSLIRTYIFLPCFFELWTEILINNVVPLALISFFSDLSLSPFVYSLYQENILNQFVVRFMSHLRRSRCSSSFIHNGLMKFQFFNFL